MPTGTHHELACLGLPTLKSEGTNEISRPQIVTEDWPNGGLFLSDSKSPDFHFPSGISYQKSSVDIFAPRKGQITVSRTPRWSTDSKIQPLDKTERTLKHQA